MNGATDDTAGWGTVSTEIVLDMEPIGGRTRAMGAPS